jgi:hypothetical protein
MPGRVTERLSAARRKRFVGRAGERTVFQSALTASELPFQVLHLYGPGGVGKTTLLGEFVSLAEQEKTPAYYLDARNLEPTPDSFLAALTSAMGLAPDQSSLQILSTQTDRRVVLVDTYETLVPLDSWLRDVFLPQLSENTLVVLAGREPPSAAWQADPGWQSALHVLPLRNLSPEESRAYLDKCNIPAKEHEAVLNFTHGHPLALSLVGDVFAQRPGLHFQPDAAPDIVKTLLERFVQKVPGPAHRAALEAAAMVRVTTEALLATMLRPANSSADATSDQSAHELFEWLRGLSFIETSREGLFPHDLAREALLTDLRWRNPDWYKELHDRSRNYYASRIQQTRGLEQQRILYDYVFLHRDNPVIRSMMEWQSGTLIAPDALRAEDRAACVAIVRQHEGTESAKIAAMWFASQPESVTVYRDEQGAVIGFIAMLSLERATPEEINADPAARLALDYLRRNAPLRPGEVAGHYRFWMARDTYQDVSSVQTLIFLNTVRYQLTTRGLAYHFFPTANPKSWEGAFAYANLARLTEIDYTVGNRTYGVYGHDWRVEPPLAWLQLLAEREVAGGQPTALPQPVRQIIVLSQDEFAAAVRDALRDITRTEALSKNPLLQSRIVTERVGPTSMTNERAVALQTLLKDSAQSLQATPRDAKLYRALDVTYLHPAPTQERAAEAIDLPFSTYRRHLKEGIDRVIDILWQKEIGR